jgi:hypothetical protein
MWQPFKNLTSRQGHGMITVTVRSDDAGVTLFPLGDHESISFQWPDVDEIRTYKRDLFTTDMICLAFLVADRWIEISEDDDGFTALTEMMAAKFPAIPVDWYAEVMQPTFAMNERTLWKRG